MAAINSLTRAISKKQEQNITVTTNAAESRVGVHSEPDLFEDNEVSTSNSPHGAKVQNLHAGQDKLMLDSLSCLAAWSAVKSSAVQPEALLAFLGNIDSSHPLFLHAYLCLLQNLIPTLSKPLSSNELSVLLQPLSEVCSQFRLDQEVCALILPALVPVITALGLNEHEKVVWLSDSSLLNGPREKLLGVVHGFWKLYLRRNITVPVRLALLSCITSLLEGDT
uniref:serine-protein kinase ATM-like n=1 Tax=Myxine glutinosa TaxID=7769 RepID=UPI00358E45C0